MADGLNKVYCMGNLGDDPILRATSSGSSVMTLSVGCNDSWLDKNRVRQERVEWIRVVVWGKRAEALAKFLRKGAKVFVEGRMQTTSYEDREGVKRYKTEVVAENIILGGSNKPRNQKDDPERRRPNRRDEDDEQHPPDRSAPSSGGGGDDGGSGFNGGGDDDIPFTRVTPAEREIWWRF